MKSRAASFSSLARIVLLATLMVVALAGCGGKRPVSALTDADRLALDDYEQIRVALAADDARAAKNASTKMVADLTPPDPKAPAPPLLTAAKAVADAMALDMMRQRFERLSNLAVPMAEGREGYYIMKSDLPNTAPWVQRTQDVDNPFFGKVLHWVGDPKKK